MTEFSTSAAQFLDALVAAGWLALAAWLVVLIAPYLRDLLRSRSFTLKFAGFEVSVQNAADQLSSQVADLRRDILDIRARMGLPAVSDAAGGTETTPQLQKATPRVEQAHLLWVDDNPENNALLINQLRDQGVLVTTARSTDEGLALVTGQQKSLDAVITDMARREKDGFHPAAGVELVERLREKGIDAPALLFTSHRGLMQARRDGTLGQFRTATDSSVELLASLADLNLIRSGGA